ncbi:MAG: hypothetical protein PHR14_08810 [Oscillospiraceae bacterium]|nr:hypothetical protein [Oscillospiraceae bacterium]
MTRKLVTLKITQGDYDRFKIWCSICNMPMSDSIGYLLDRVGFPTVSELELFAVGGSLQKKTEKSEAESEE